jgi:hypothetical protein
MRDCYISRQSIHAFYVLDANSLGGMGRRFECLLDILILELTVRYINSAPVCLANLAANAAAWFA